MTPEEKELYTELIDVLKDLNKNIEGLKETAGLWGSIGVGKL